MLKEILNKVYEYDVIVPKGHKANEISIMIENEAEKMSFLQNKDSELPSRLDKKQEYLDEILDEIDENETIFEKAKFTKKSKRNKIPRQGTTVSIYLTRVFMYRRI